MKVEKNKQSTVQNDSCKIIQHFRIKELLSVAPFTINLIFNQTVNSWNVILPLFWLSCWFLNYTRPNHRKHYSWEQKWSWRIYGHTLCILSPKGMPLRKPFKTTTREVFHKHPRGRFCRSCAGEPDFRTPFGTAIANQSQLIGYPAGTVNRHYFSGWAQNGDTGTAMSRNRWTPASNLTLDEIRFKHGRWSQRWWQTRELTVHVEGYYTGDSQNPPTNWMWPWFKNNTPGPQVGGGMGDQYVFWCICHHPMGDDVNTDNLDLCRPQYTYTIPADYKWNPAELADMELVVFMTETTQEINVERFLYTPTWNSRMM